jgi:hypothetical protein
VDRAAVMQRARGATCDRQRAPCDSTWLHVTVACNVVLERRGTHPHGACSQVPLQCQTDWVGQVCHGAYQHARRAPKVGCRSGLHRTPRAHSFAAFVRSTCSRLRVAWRVGHRVRWQRESTAIR